MLCNFMYLVVQYSTDQSISRYNLYLKNIYTRTLGAAGPLVIAPAEGLGTLQAPCQVGVIYLKN